MECRYCAQEVKDNALKCHNCGEWLDSTYADDRHQGESYEQLYRSKVGAEITERVEKSLRKKYAWLGVVGLLITSGGITLMVNAILSGAEKNVAHIVSGAEKNVAVAEALQERSHKTLAAIDESLVKLSRLDVQLEKLGDRAKKTELRYDALLESASNLSNFSRDNLEISQEIRDDVARLTQIVNELSKKGAKADKTLSNLVTRSEEIGNSLKSSSVKIRQTVSRVKLAKYPVALQEFEDIQDYTEALKKELKDLGYSIRVLPAPGRNIKKNQAIAVGKDVPIEIAVPVIRLAKEHLPFLIYLRFGRFLDSTVHIGASSAVTASLGVRPFNDSEFKKATDPTQTQKEFHSLIKSLYH